MPDYAPAFYNFTIILAACSSCSSGEHFEDRGNFGNCLPVLATLYGYFTDFAESGKMFCLTYRVDFDRL